jgi:hypothetical protein
MSLQWHRLVLRSLERRQRRQFKRAQQRACLIEARRLLVVRLEAIQP